MEPADLGIRRLPALGKRFFLRLLDAFVVCKWAA